MYNQTHSSHKTHSKTSKETGQYLACVLLVHVVDNVLISKTDQ